MADLPHPTYYCSRCRRVVAAPRSLDPLCPTCPGEEPLVDVSDLAQRASIEELEAAALDRHTYAWMAGLGVGLGMVGMAFGWVLVMLTNLSELLYAGLGAGIVGGVALGRVLARRLWTRGGRAAGVQEALKRR